MGWKQQIVYIVKACTQVLWLAIRPIRRTEEVYGMVGLVVTVAILLGLAGAALAGAFAPSPLPDHHPDGL